MPPVDWHSRCEKVTVLDPFWFSHPAYSKKARSGQRRLSAYFLLL